KQVAVGTFFHGGGFFFHGIPSEATPSMRLPSTRLFWGRSYKFTGHQYVKIFHLCHSLLPAPSRALRSFHAEHLIGPSTFRQAKEQ
ncbi:MAG: hypothetical protein PUF07_08310, partial [Bacteroidales bacterium]|nr:hypothetical protein [Bacteroidales bacterium]